MATKIVYSPLPGIFYRRPAPDEPPYVRENDTCAEGDVIGLIEVMKSFHEVNSVASGKVSKFLVENEATVIAGQPLVELEA